MTGNNVLKMRFFLLAGSFATEGQKHGELPRKTATHVFCVSVPSVAMFYFMGPVVYLKVKIQYRVRVICFVGLDGNAEGLVVTQADLTVTQ